MTVAVHSERMYDYLNGSLILLNSILAVVLVDYLNVTAAATGVLVTLFANVGRIANSIAMVNAIRKNGWMPLPKEEQKKQSDEDQ